MAGGLGGRARRVRRLEGLDGNREKPSPSQTEREARALDAEIRKVEEELRALGADPDERCPADDRMDLSLEEQIAALENEIAAIEKELGDDDDH
jgi:hypothetical protein